MAKKRGAKSIIQRTPASSAAGKTVSSSYVAWVATCALPIVVPLTVANFRLRGTDAGALLANQVDLPKALLVLALLAVVLASAILAIAGGQLRLRRTPFDIGVLLMLGWLAITVPFAVYAPHALLGSYNRLEGFLAYVGYAIAFWAAVHLVASQKRMYTLARASAFTAAAIAVYALLQAGGVDPIAWEVPWGVGRVFGTFGNPQLFGGYLALVLPLALSLALSEDEQSQRLWSAATLLIALALTLTFTRSAWAAGAIGATIVLGAAVRAKVISRNIAAGIVAAGITAVSVIGALTTRSDSDVTNLFKRLISTFDPSSGSVATRLDIMRSAAAATAERPLTGWGLDSFGLVWQRFVPPSYVERAGWAASADNAHNWLLQLAATAGVPAAILVIGLVVWILARTARSAFLREGQAPHLVYAGFWAACLSYVVHLQGSISLPGITVLLWLFLGVLARPSSRELNKAPSVPPVAAWVFAGALGVFTLITVASSVRADAALLRARNADDAVTRVTALRDARSSAPYVLRYRKDLAKAQQLLASQGPPGSPVARAAYESARSEYLALISAAPEWPEPYIELVSVYNVGATITGDTSLSAAAFSAAQEALAFAPNDPLTRTKAAIAAANSGEIAEAIALLESAIALDSRYSEPWIVRYRILLATGDTEGARRTAEEMERRFPEDPAVREILAGN